MIDAGGKIAKITGEDEDFYSNDDIYSINSWGADLSFRELIDRYENDELLKPELQRHYVWDKSEASRFIDSILLGLPVPSIFLAKQKDETLLIIDGYQRIMTVYDYVRGVFSADGKVFKLSNTEKVNIHWRGKTFNELSDSEQRRIKNTTIHAIIFMQSHPTENDTGMYQVFERINTSGRTLYPQEIRNCVYHGAFNYLLFELNQVPEWRLLFGTGDVDSRMRDMEFILRFLMLRGLNLEEITSTSISLKKELNLFMGRESNNTQVSLDGFRLDFTETISKVLHLFGESAFHNISPKNPTKLVPKFNATIYDSLMIAVATSDYDPESCGDWEERRREMLRNETYQDAIRIRTTNIDKIQIRIGLARTMLCGVGDE